MLLRIGSIVPLLLVFAMTSCTRPGDRGRLPEAELVGVWTLQKGHDCEDYPIESDVMILHADGRFDQHTVTKSGQRIDSVGQHWHYMDKDSVSLDKRRDWDSHIDPALPAAKSGSAGRIDPAGKSELQVLIVQFKSPPVILINPDLDCVYIKTK